MPISVTKPGGRSRNVWRVAFPTGERAIVVYRNNENQAKLERFVLSNLAHGGAPIPKLIAGASQWTIQSDLGTDRLQNLSNENGQGDIRNIYSKALDGLLTLQSTGVDLARFLGPIGKSQGWMDNLLCAPARVGEITRVGNPDIDKQELANVLGGHRSKFIKWDARSGNAVLAADGTVGWIDFEHCGLRDPLDDLAWFLGDEFFQDENELDVHLIDDFVSAFAGDLPVSVARRYLTVMGTLHMCIRLELILKRRGTGPWWSQDACREMDLIGVTEAQFLSLVSRVKRWSENENALSPLIPWLDEVQEQTQTLPSHKMSFC